MCLAVVCVEDGFSQIQSHLMFSIYFNFVVDTVSHDSYMLLVFGLMEVE